MSQPPPAPASEAEQHRRHAHPDYEYCITECAGVTRETTYPQDGRDGWKENLHFGPQGRVWLGHNEGTHWYRLKSHPANPNPVRRYHPASTADLFAYYGQKHEF